MTENASGKPAFENVDQLADQLMDRADGDQVQLLGPDGLLTQLRATRNFEPKMVPEHTRPLAGFTDGSGCAGPTTRPVAARFLFGNETCPFPHVTALVDLAVDLAGIEPSRGAVDGRGHKSPIEILAEGPEIVVQAARSRRK